MVDFKPETLPYHLLSMPYGISPNIMKVSGIKLTNNGVELVTTSGFNMNGLSGSMKQTLG